MLGVNQVSNNPIRQIYVNLIAILLSQKNPKAKVEKCERQGWNLFADELQVVISNFSN